MPVLAAANVNGMELRAGAGNELSGGRPREGDEFNVVWVVDSNVLPFYRRVYAPVEAPASLAAARPPLPSSCARHACPEKG